MNDEQFSKLLKMFQQIIENQNTLEEKINFIMQKINKDLEVKDKLSISEELVTNRSTSSIVQHEEYINTQTGEKLDWDRVTKLKDNAILKVRPDLWEQWVFEKNDELGLDIWEMTKGSAKKAYWICKKGHEWESAINSRNSGNGCPYCGNQKVLKGYNDMWTTKPELASLLADPEDGYRYAKNSHKSVNWKCRNCSHIQENIKISVVANCGFKCDNCSERNMSYISKHPTLENLKLDENNNE